MLVFFRIVVRALKFKSMRYREKPRGVGGIFYIFDGLLSSGVCEPPISSARQEHSTPSRVSRRGMHPGAMPMMGGLLPPQPQVAPAPAKPLFPAAQVGGTIRFSLLGFQTSVHCNAV